MKRYVLGFCFSPSMRSVVLVKKVRPSWQAGYLNGVGGKVEHLESFEDAMQREFSEEAGYFGPLKWVQFGLLRYLKSPEMEVALFWSRIESASLPFHIHQGEQVSSHFVDIVLQKGESQGVRVLPDVSYMLPMALHHIDQGDCFMEVSVPPPTRTSTSK
jgi:NUDIX domain